MTHTAISHARTPGKFSRLRADLVWPYDCARRCNESVRVASGRDVAEELTRNLRPGARRAITEQFDA